MAVDMYGSTITNIPAPGRSGKLTVSNHTHSMGAIGSGGSLGIQGAPGPNGIPSPVVISNGNLNIHGGHNPTGTQGAIKFTPDGNIMAHDGNDWVLLCGVGEKTQIDKIKDVLRECWPEVLFDLMMRDLI